MKKWIVFSTLVAIFSEKYFINIGPIHLLFFYFILLFNLAILTAKGSLWLPNGLVLFLAYITVSGVFGLLVGTNSGVGFAKAYSGIVPSVIYFIAFFRYMKFDVEWLFAWYARLTFYVSLIGLIYLPFQAFPKGQLKSVFSEPGNFCLVCVPAVLYYADEWRQKRVHGFRLITVLLAVIATVSSSGYMGLLLAVYLLGTKYRFGKVLAPIVVVLIGLVVYNFSAYFRLRFNDTTSSLSNADVTGVNQSTFGLVSNVFVVSQQFQEHPILGGGLGSHVVAFEKYIGHVPGVEIFEEIGVADLGRWDASSFLLRIISELGLVGLVGGIWFLWYWWPRSATPEQRRIALCVLLYVFIKSLRFGNYFNPEVFFFFGAYFVNGLKSRVAMRQRKQKAVPSFSSRPALLPVAEC